MNNIHNQALKTVKKEKGKKIFFKAFGNESCGRSSKMCDKLEKSSVSFL